MQLPPAAVLLTWPIPNYVDPSVVRGPELLIVTGIFFPLAVLMVAIRIFTRLQISKAFGLDDMFLIAAIIPSGAIAVLTSLAITHWGWNRHIWDVPFDLITRGLKLTIAMECLFGVAVSCTKISLLILTRRIMSRGMGVLRHIASAGIFIVASEAIVFSLVVIFTCSPVSDYWTLSVTPQKCISERTHLLVGGIINTMTDFLVFLLPLPIVWSLKIHRRQQILVCALFGAGFVVCIAGTVRIWFAWKTTSTFDRTWISYPLWISSVLELDIGIICTSIPACKPFVSRYIPNLLGTSFAGTSKQSEYYTGGSISNPNTNRQAAQAQFSKEPSIFLEPISAFELQPHRTTKSRSKINSTQMLPLSYLDVSESHLEIESPRDRAHVRRMSSETGETQGTSVSSLVATGESPAATIPHTTLPVQEDPRVDRAESREGLVKRYI